MQPEFLALKIGGSLFSDKSQEGSLDVAVIDRYARTFAVLAGRFPGRVVLITGGGAIGHGAIRNQPQAGAFPLAGLTQACFTVKSAWTGALSQAGARAFPLQLAAFCSLAGDKPVLAPGVLLALLRHGALPVLSGDCLLTDAGTLAPCSSDRIPELLLDVLPGRVRIVTLTDVPGLTAGPSGPTLRELDARDPVPGYDLLWQQSQWDSTGGMRGKLDALVSCALAGAECFIMQGGPLLRGAAAGDGTNAGSAGDLSFLFDPVTGWPDGARYTRIA